MLTFFMYNMEKYENPDQISFLTSDDIDELNRELDDLLELSKYGLL